MPTKERRAVEVVPCPLHRVPSGEPCPTPSGACKARLQAAPDGRKHKVITSAGWASVSVRLPLPTVLEYRALPAAARSRVQRELREVVERAIAAGEG